MKEIKEQKKREQEEERKRKQQIKDEDGNGEDEDGEEVKKVKYEKNPNYPLNVLECKWCRVPYEYCDYVSENLERCKEWMLKV